MNPDPLSAHIAQVVEEAVARAIQPLLAQLARQPAANDGTRRRMTVEEVARELSCSTRHVHRLIRAGRLVAAKVGAGKSRVLVERVSVEQLLKQSQL